MYLLAIVDPILDVALGHESTNDALGGPVLLCLVHFKLGFIALLWVNSLYVVPKKRDSLAKEASKARDELCLKPAFVVRDFPQWSQTNRCFWPGLCADSLCLASTTSFPVRKPHPSSGHSYFASASC